jgi:hypothetical protein
VNGFRHAYARQIAVALIGKDYFVGAYALDSRRNRGRSAVGGLLYVAVKIIVSKNRATDRRDAYYTPIAAKLL